MILFIEIIIGIILFTILIVPRVLKDPLSAIGDYPPQIRRRCVELGLVEDRKKRFSKKEMLRKCLCMIVLPVVFALIMYKINGTTSFVSECSF